MTLLTICAVHRSPTHIMWSMDLTKKVKLKLDLKLWKVHITALKKSWITRCPFIPSANVFFKQLLWSYQKYSMQESIFPILQMNKFYFNFARHAQLHTRCYLIHAVYCFNLIKQRMYLPSFQASYMEVLLMSKIYLQIYKGKH